ncbi:Scytalone dehydratase [Aspergillus alliaceus]|uniref:Scytalone dehydratase n=1 Tax=Petromyces alliaceus TaxID=209559 RepID=UPI0012A778B7|nr:Scytalone dehydratase [Aspergillus alliaceus]KAB8238263.1 Scytalone dehydratase [Aspergillus alliaceus]
MCIYERVLSFFFPSKTFQCSVQCNYLAINRLAFEWAESYDKKDWNRLHNILAPNIAVDYSMMGYQCFPHMKSEEFISMMSSPDLLGDPLIHTQHLLGGTGYERIRAAHQRYANLDLTSVAHRGHGHGIVKHWYKKIDGYWKLAGIRPEMYWTEHDFDKIFPRLSAAK